MEQKGRKSRLVKVKNGTALSLTLFKEKEQDIFSKPVSVKSQELEFRGFGTSLSQMLGCQDHKPRTMATPLCAMQTASQVVNAPASFPLESTGDGVGGRGRGWGEKTGECVRAALIPRILEHSPCRLS